MTARSRPFRSVLYIPGSKTRALEKAKGLPADAIIFDLEDAVAPAEKAAARETLCEALAEGGYGQRTRIARINGLDTPWGRDDAAAIAGKSPDAVLLPKVGGPQDIEDIAPLVGDLPVWAMIESPLGVLNVAGIAAHPRVEGLVMGTNDLAKDMNLAFRPDRLPLVPALGACVVAAKAHGVAIVDGVYNAFKDDQGLRAECEQGREMGFDGKTLIHPAQVDIANAAFAPTEAEIELAGRHIAAFEEAEAAGQGVAVVDGKIVENLHVAAARELLDRSRAIAAIGGA